MSGIHELVMNHLQDRLTQILIANVSDGTGRNGTRAGVIIQGPLQGDPDPDVARISVELYENDPDQEISGSGIGAAPINWQDQIEEVEIGGCLTWRRCFTVKIRCLMDTTQENLVQARRVASTVRTRAEHAILTTQFHGVQTEDGEFVSRGALSDDLISEMRQSGGPPDSYDFGIKIRFTILTTTGVVEE
jgi:hypothetical protein